MTLKQLGTLDSIRKFLEGNQGVEHLVAIDERHDRPCGQTIKVLCERAVNLFGEIAYQNLSNISVAHLYNLRGSNGYKKQRRTFEPRIILHLFYFT